MLKTWDNIEKLFLYNKIFPEIFSFFLYGVRRTVRRSKADSNCSMALSNVYRVILLLPVSHLSIVGFDTPIKLANSFCVRIFNYTKQVMFRAFGNVLNPTYEEYIDFLKSRTFVQIRFPLVSNIVANERLHIQPILHTLYQYLTMEQVCYQIQ